MTHPKPSQTQTTTTKHINVTNLTQKQRQQVFESFMSQDDFIGFVKNQHDRQTEYVFHYFCHENKDTTH
jgi:hypothetical protein